MFMSLFERNYKVYMYKSIYQSVCHIHKNTVSRVKNLR